jgi:peptide/nickel transport system permease protein
MGAFILRRALLGVLVVFGVLVLTFVLTRVVPSDPVSQWVGPRATAAQRVAARGQLGLDKPIYVQFRVFLAAFVRGDLGTSLASHQPVSKELRAFLPATADLMFVAVAFAVLLGIPMGVFSARYKDRRPDHIARVVAVSAVSMPTFWLALLLQMVFFRWLHLLPLGGQQSQYYSVIQPVPKATGFLFLDCVIAGNWGALVDYLQHLIMPAIALGAGTLAVLARMTRSSMLEILNEDYITAARSYGLSEGVVLWRYAFKNSIGPTVTVLALQIGWLLVNTFLVETIFNWPGIGNYIATSVVTLNYPAIIAVTLLSAVAYVILNAVADIVIAVDPRVRH